LVSLKPLSTGFVQVKSSQAAVRPCSAPRPMKARYAAPGDPTGSEDAHARDPEPAVNPQARPRANSSSNRRPTLDSGVMDPGDTLRLRDTAVAYGRCGLSPHCAQRQRRRAVARARAAALAGAAARCLKAAGVWEAAAARMFLRCLPVPPLITQQQ
jgi:hypothetical protein